nr:hypothetical protein [Enterovibrio nigricans]
MKQEYRYGDTPSSHVDTNAILASALQQSTLNWPLLSESQEVALLRHFAPVVSVETLSRDDLPGRLTFNHYNDAILDTTQPTIYQGVTYTRFQGNVLVQLNYVLWFAARTAKTAFDPYAGKFDAINLRLTLDHSGQPFIFDSIHQCGCFHMVYALSPTLSFSSDEGERPISVTLPQPDENDRLHVSLSAGEHMITQVEFTDNIQPQLPVSTLSWQQVSTVPITNGEYRSPFDREGILTESARGERWFLWPFGVRSPGAMRQQGKHAIAFIGERHFDDALLFEELLLVE